MSHLDEKKVDMTGNPRRSDTGLYCRVRTAKGLISLWPVFESTRRHQYSYSEMRDGMASDAPVFLFVGIGRYPFRSVGWRGRE